MNSVPEQIDRYRLLEEVGRGGMAVVYRGQDPSLDREVAIKVLHAHLANDPESRARFQREARAVARLHHPHIIEIFDFADSGEGPSYIVTEFIKGQTLKAFMDGHQAFFPEIAIMIAIELCEAVGHAHELQIIHRDLKPENIMVDQEGILKLMDFGIAKVIDQQQQMTLTGSILGSPAHMAPELLEGKDLDFRSDLFSIGTVLYWLATGVLPFTGRNPHQILKGILEGTYPDPQQVNPMIGSDLARVIRKALARQPEDRYASAASMQAALLELLAELGILDVESELRLFFADPAVYFEALKKRVSQHLLDKGRQWIHERKHRIALESFDRLLALDPSNVEAMNLVNGIHRRRHIQRRVLWGVSSFLLCSALSLGGWALLTYAPAINNQNEDAGKGSQLAQESGPMQDAGATTMNGIEAPSVDGGLAAGYDPTQEANRAPFNSDAAVAVIHKPDSHPITDKPPSSGAKHPIKIFTDPFFDRILIDGREVALANEATKYGQIFLGDLASGKHKAVIQRNGCQDDEFEIDVQPSLKPGENMEFRRQLHFRPATLRVETDILQTAVYVDGVFKGNAQETSQNPITITMEGRQGRREVKVRLTNPELGTLDRVLLLEAGKQAALSIKRGDFAKLGQADGGTR